MYWRKFMNISRRISVENDQKLKVLTKSVIPQLTPEKYLEKLIDDGFINIKF